MTNHPNRSRKIVLQIQRQANGTYSAFDAKTGYTATEGLQEQSYHSTADRMAADRGGDWEEIEPAAYEPSATTPITYEDATDDEEYF